MTDLKTIDIDTLPAGREMDALVAELMGWTPPTAKHIRYRDGGNLWWVSVTDEDDPDRWDRQFSPWASYTTLQKYSTSIATTWEVWEWAKGTPERWDRFTEQLWSDSQDASDVPIEDEDIISNLLLFISPESICRAALKAKERSQ